MGPGMRPTTESAPSSRCIARSEWMEAARYQAVVQPNAEASSARIASAVFPTRAAGPREWKPDPRQTTSIFPRPETK